MQARRTRWRSVRRLQRVRGGDVFHRLPRLLLAAYVGGALDARQPGSTDLERESRPGRRADAGLRAADRAERTATDGHVEPYRPRQAEARGPSFPLRSGPSQWPGAHATAQRQGGRVDEAAALRR